MDQSNPVAGGSGRGGQGGNRGRGGRGGNRGGSESSVRGRGRGRGGNSYNRHDRGGSVGKSRGRGYYYLNRQEVARVAGAAGSASGTAAALELNEM